MPSFSLRELQARFGGEIQGDADVVVDSAASLQTARAHQISFMLSRDYLDEAASSQCGALVLAPSLCGSTDKPGLLCTNPHAAFARIVDLLHPPVRPPAGVHAGASVAPTATLGKGVSIGSGAVVEADANIGDGCIIASQAYVGRGAVIGQGTWLHPRASVLFDCEIGARCILHSGCVIGSDGFGNAWDNGQWVKIPQIGRVIIGNDVEVGANTTIDRGALDDTVIEDGVRLDNLIQVAHNCRIGRHTAIAACTAIAGSTHIGANCRIGGASMITGHLRLADGVNLSGGTLIAKHINTAGTYTAAMPSMPHADWKRNAAHLRHLDELAARIKRIEKQFRKD